MPKRQSMNYKDYYERLSVKQKILFWIVSAPIITIGMYYMFIYWIGSLVRWLGESKEGYTIMQYGYEYKNYALIGAVILLFIILIGNIIGIRRGYKNRVASEDDRGIKYMRDGTEGTRHPADKEEVKTKFNVGDIKETFGMIFGQYGKGLKEVVSYKEKEKGAKGTMNVLAVAKSGSGKTYSIVIINIIQCALRRHSQVIVDVKGDIYPKLVHFLKMLRIDVKLLNLKELLYTNFYNIMQETIDQKKERIDTKRLKIFTDIFMKNSEGEKKRDVWYNGAHDLIQMVIGLCAYRREKRILDGYIALYESLTGESNSQFAKVLNEEDIGFPKCEEQIRKIAVAVDYPLDKLEKIFKDIKDSAPVFNLNAVYETMANVDTLDEELSAIPSYHPAWASANRYLKIKVNDLKNGFISGAQTRFKIFDDKKLRDALSYDGIDFKNINKKPSAYFVAVPDSNTSLNVISSLFFSFFYYDVMEVYDEEEQLSENEEGRKNPCIPVMAMLEEFGSLGVVCGDEKQFGTVMSTCRSRLIYSILILQTISQLESNYGADVADIIISSCEYKLNLGVNDEKSKRFFAQMSGLATVMQTSYKQEERFFTKAKDSDTTMNISTTRRYVYTEAECEDLSEDKVMVFKFATNPFILDLVPWVEHPVVLEGKCPKVPFYKSIKNIEDAIADIKLKENYDLQTDVHNEIKAITDSGLQDKLKLQKLKDEEMREYYNKFEKSRLIDVIMLMTKDKEKNKVVDKSPKPIETSKPIEERSVKGKETKSKKAKTAQDDEEIKNVISTFLN